jgi:hypothetical protein
VKTKLQGLEDAITLRMSRQLDALEDANYDVSKYRARDRGDDGASGAAKRAAELIKKHGGGE